jgi:hypothetical protein
VGAITPRLGEDRIDPGARDDALQRPQAFVRWQGD